MKKIDFGCHFQCFFYHRLVVINRAIRDRVKSFFAAELE